uniref:Uncharacterized protein n=1 Tax=Romanomermis culicivorax TaxID=13658 RepID=A0A915KH45_ROMCU
MKRRKATTIWRVVRRRRRCRFVGRNWPSKSG